MAATVDPFASYRGSLNKYAYMPLVNTPLTNYPNDPNDPNDNIAATGAYNIRLNSKLCDIAGMEGWHDHHGITNFGESNITASVNAYVPNGCAGAKPVANEPAFLNSVVSNANANASAWKTFPSNFNQSDWYGNITDLNSPYAMWKTNFSQNITDKYVIALVKFPTKASPMEPSYSNVQKCFNMNQINDNVYILRDVAYGGWGRDIRKWGQNLPADTEASEQYIYNVQTSSGIYDPGPSLSYFSDAGINCGYQAMESKSRYGLFDCYFPAETILDYPAYPIPANVLTSAEQLMYTKYNCKLFGDNSIPNILGDTFINKAAEIMVDSAAVNLIVEVPGTTTDPMDKQLYIVTKHTSNKASSIFDLPFISSCIKYSAAVDAIDIASATYNFSKYDIIERSGPLKIMTKKFGDSGIAIQTLRSNLNFYAFNPAANNNVTISKQQSNGIHAFLTYDQVATGAALEYGAPIVIYNTKSTAGLLGATEHDYAIIFISKTMQTALSSPEVRLKSAIVSAQNLSVYGGVNLQDTLPATQAAFTLATDTLKAATQAVFTLATDTLKAALDAQAAQVVKLMRNIGSESLSTKHDIDYRIFLTKWYKLATLIKIYTDNNASFVTLNDPTNNNNIIQRYVQAVSIKANKIQEAQGIDNTIESEQVRLTTDLDNISNSYREYATMMNSYTSIANTFRDLNTSISTIDKIKIGDTSKIIDNCDPYNGTFKVYRIRKMLTSFQGQSEALIELGTVVIIQIYENLKGSIIVQTEFKDQIRNIFNNIKTTCAQNLIPKLELAFNFIPNEQDVITQLQPPDNFTGYRDLFVPKNQAGGRVESNLLQQTPLDRPAMDGPQATYPTLMLDNKNSTPNVLAAGPKAPNEELLNKPSSIVNSPVIDNHMFTDVLTQLDQLIELIVASSTDMVTDKRSENMGQILQNMKPLLESTKKVIETQGPIYIDTLNTPLSYKHLQADALIHQPQFVFSFLQTILQYYGYKTVNNPNDLTGGVGRNARLNKNQNISENKSQIKANIKMEETKINLGKMLQRVREANRVDNLDAKLFPSSPIRRTRLSTAPFNVTNMKTAITQYYINKQPPPESLPNVTTVSLVKSAGTPIKVNVYGYILPIIDLLMIIKDLSITYRSNEESSGYELVQSRDAETGSVIEDVTTSWSIAQTIFAGDTMSNVNLYNPNTLDTDNNNNPIFIAQAQQNPGALFIAFINYIDVIRIYNENWMILNPDSQQDLPDIEINKLTPIVTQLHNISQALNNALNNSNVQLLADNLDDYEYALRAVFPVTYYPPLDLPKRKGGNMNKKTIRQPKKPKTNKHSKTRRKYAKTKQPRTKKRTKKSNVRGPIKTRP